MRKIQNRILEWLQRRCPHLPEWVTLDIMEGDFTPGVYVSQCNRCGAVKICRDVANLERYPSWKWREPRATWTERVVF